MAAAGAAGGEEAEGPGAGAGFPAHAPMLSGYKLQLALLRIATEQYLKGSTVRGFEHEPNWTCGNHVTVALSEALSQKQVLHVPCAQFTRTITP